MKNLIVIVFVTLFPCALHGAELNPTPPSNNSASLSAWTLIAAVWNNVPRLNPFSKPHAEREEEYLLLQNNRDQWEQKYNEQVRKEKNEVRKELRINRGKEYAATAAKK